MSRDIVQFVPFNDCKKDEFTLAKQVLGELPKQITEYFLKQGITPNSSSLAQRQFKKIALAQTEKTNAAKMDLFKQQEKATLINMCV